MRRRAANLARRLGLSTGGPAEEAPPPGTMPSLPRLLLWRFYAFVGRHAPRGNRARLRAWLDRRKGS
jgi:hypothetical protein